MKKLAALFLVLGAPAAAQQVWNFDKDAAGKPPSGFTSELTGQGAKGAWEVRAVPDAPSKPNVLAQTSTDATDYRFPLAIAQGASYKDLEIRVKFKAVSGKVDQAGGVIFRGKDANNYYVVRANAAENNYRLYHVTSGRRRQFAGASFPVSANQWHELRVEAVGNRFKCYFDGQLKFEATDETFREAGAVGLWTKADSVTWFDDFEVHPK